MTVPPWNNAARTFERINALLKGELPLKYAGWRIVGQSEDRDKTKVPVGLAAVWPQPSTCLQTEGVTTWLASIGAYHYELLVVGRTQAEIGQRTAQARATVVQCRLRPDIISQTAEAQAAWEADPLSVRLQVLAMLEMGARAHEVPLAFLLFMEVEGTGRPYVQLWHPQNMTPLVALETVQFLYRRHAMNPN